MLLLLLLRHGATCHLPRRRQRYYAVAYDIATPRCRYALPLPLIYARRYSDMRCCHAYAACFSAAAFAAAAAAAMSRRYCLRHCYAVFVAMIIAVTLADAAAMPCC